MDLATFLQNDQYVFFVLIGVVMFGLGIVGWILVRDKGPNDFSAEPISAEEATKRFVPKTAVPRPPLPSKLNAQRPPQRPPIKKPPAPPAPPKNIFSKKVKPAPDILSPKNKGAAQIEKKKGMFGKFVDKIGLGKNKMLEDFEIPEPTPLPNLKDVLALEKSNKAGSPTSQPQSQASSPGGTSSPAIGTSAVKAGAGPSTFSSDKSDSKDKPAGPQISKEEEDEINKEVDASLQLFEFKNKYAQLDKIFSEKSAELEKIKTSLENELRNRKEFNKVKDLLEKELKDTKDRTKEVQNELNCTNTENEGFKKRIHLLEEKVTSLEKEINEKEDALSAIEKELKTKPSAPSPEHAVSEPSPVGPASADEAIILSPNKEPEPTSSAKEGQSGREAAPSIPQSSPEPAPVSLEKPEVEQPESASPQPGTHAEPEKETSEIQDTLQSPEKKDTEEDTPPVIPDNPKPKPYAAPEQSDQINQAPQAPEKPNSNAPDASENIPSKPSKDATQIKESDSASAFDNEIGENKDEDKEENYLKLNPDVVFEIESINKSATDEQPPDGSPNNSTHPKNDPQFP